MDIRLSDHFSYGRLLRFCLSPVMMMLFISIYGVVDGLFISNFVGKTPLAAINLIMPVNFILGGLGFMAGTGGSALVGKVLGEGRKEDARRYFTMMVRFVLIAGSIAAVVTAIFIERISIALGADSEMLEFCVAYGFIIILFSPAYMLQNMFQNFLTTAEKPRLGLVVTVVSGVLNMLLDALFIAVFGWGVKGAAIATGLSQLTGCMIPIFYFLRPNTSLLQFTKTRFEWGAIGRACYNGFSELLSSISGSVVSIVYNFQLLRFAGSDGVAAYGVMMYLHFVFVAIFIGYSIGSSPIVSFHYGAGNKAELKSLLRKSTVLTLSAGFIIMFLSQILANPLSQIFVGYDPDLAAMTEHGLRLFAVCFVLVGFNIFSSSFFTALNNGTVSAIIAFLRTLVFQLIPVMILPIFIGLDGIWWAISVSELGAFLVSVVFLVHKRRQYEYF